MNLNNSLSLDEFICAMKKLTLHKNRVSPSAIKVLDDENTQVLFDSCSKYFEGYYKINEW